MLQIIATPLIKLVYIGGLQIEYGGEGGYWAVDYGGSESEIFTHTHCGSEIGRENLRSPASPNFLKGGDLSVSVSVFENIGTRSQITTREIFFFFFLMIAFFMIHTA